MTHFSKQPRETRNEFVCRWKLGPAYNSRERERKTGALILREYVHTDAWLVYSRPFSLSLSLSRYFFPGAGERCPSGEREFDSCLPGNSLSLHTRTTHTLRQRQRARFSLSLFRPFAALGIVRASARSRFLFSHPLSSRPSLLLNGLFFLFIFGVGCAVCKGEKKRSPRAPESGPVHQQQQQPAFAYRFFSPSLFALFASLYFSLSPFFVSALWKMATLAPRRACQLVSQPGPQPIYFTARSIFILER